MNRPPAAPMPESIRHILRAKQHPARAVDCPHCGAAARRPCTTPSKRRILTDPHPQRVSDWAKTSACCPECQVEPGIPCRTADGFPLSDVHDRRHQEAEETLA